MKKKLIVFLAVVLIFSPNIVDAQKNSKIEKNKDFIQTFTENFWNKHDIAVIEKYIASDFIIHFDDGDQNFEQYKGICQAYFAAFPDMHITTNDVLAEGDKVVKVWTMNGTNKGDFMGIPATGMPIVVKGMEVFRIENGKIAELWISMDNLGLLKQLGVIPPMGE